MNLKKATAGLALAISLITSGCEDTGAGGQAGSTPADVVSKVLESQKKMGSYYAESTIRTYQNDQLLTESFSKEWVEEGTGRKRVEIKSGDDEAISVNEGQELLTYDKKSNTAFTMKLDESMGTGSMSQKDQLMNLIKSMQSTHNYEVAGEEQVLGNSAYHVKVTPEKQNTLLGELEFWVDSRTWFILKSSSASGDMKVESEYTKLDFAPKFTDDTFRLKLPDDVVMQSIQDMHPAREVSLKEAEEELKQPFLLFDDKELSLLKTELLEFKGSLNRTEINMNFAKDHMPSLHLSVFKVPEDAAWDPLGEEIQIRQVKGQYMEMIRSVAWDEDGLRYTIIIENPDLSLEQVLEMARQMKLSSK
ncbi:hypothetical protein WBG83_09250 [Paenibacillus sp. y28]